MGTVLDDAFNNETMASGAVLRYHMGTVISNTLPMFLIVWCWFFIFGLLSMRKEAGKKLKKK